MGQPLETTTILVIDDSPTNLEVLYGTLVDAGYDVLVEVDGRNAIEQVQLNPPDLILLDVLMPDIDGFEVCRQLKANSLTQSIPVIFMTALTEIHDKVTGFNLGAVDYVTKPFQQDEVLARIRLQLQLQFLNKTLEAQNLELKQLTEELEERVTERTQKLAQSLSQLQTTQAQLTVANARLEEYSETLEHQVEARTQQLKQEIIERNHAEATLQNLVAGTASVTGENFFPVLARHILPVLDVSCAIVTKRVGDDLETLAFWVNDQPQPNITYDPTQSPCQFVLQQGTYMCPMQADKLFASDSELLKIRVESYMGVALLGTQGDIIGHLCVLHHQPIQHPDRAADILKVFAARATAELERQQAIDALELLNQELETRVIQRTAALEESINRWQESEELLRLTLENAPIGIVTTSLEGRLLSVNQSFCLMVGYGTEELLQASLTEITHPDDQHLELALTQQLLENQVSNVQLEKRYLHKNGGIVDAIVRIALVRSPHGYPLCWVQEVEDVTERKRAEQAQLVTLQELEFHKFALDQAAIVAIWDQEGSLTYANDKLCEISQYDRQELLKQSHELINSNFHSVEFCQDFWDTLRTGQVWQGELKNITQQNQIYWMNATAVPLMDDQSHSSRYMAICFDITERKLAEKQLQEASLRLSSLIQNLQAGILVEDENRQIVLVNQQFCTLFGILDPPETLLGIDCNKAAHQFKHLFQNPDRFIHRLESILQQKQAIVGEEITLQDGRFFERDYVPIFAGSDYQGHLWQYRDICDRKQSEAQLKSSLHEKELLLKEIHHRVKNNLLVVSSILEFQSDYVDDPTVLRIFKESQDRIHSMALIHEKLYQSQKIDRINLAEYLENLVQRLMGSYYVEGKNIDITFDLQPITLNIETATPCGLIINELIANTFEHAFPGDRNGHIWLSCHKSNNQEITLAIRDDGLGFPEDIDFRNTESLGLQLVCLLTKQLDGVLELDTSNGTLFKLTFSELHYRKRI